MFSPLNISWYSQRLCPPFVKVGHIYYAFLCGIYVFSYRYQSCAFCRRPVDMISLTCAALLVRVVCTKATHALMSLHNCWRTDKNLHPDLTGGRTHINCFHGRTVNLPWTIRPRPSIVIIIVVLLLLLLLLLSLLLLLLILLLWLLLLSSSSLLTGNRTDNWLVTPSQPRRWSEGEGEGRWSARPRVEASEWLTLDATGAGRVGRVVGRAVGRGGVDVGRERRPLVQHVGVAVARVRTRHVPLHRLDDVLLAASVEKSSLWNTEKNVLGVK